jgi:hypothetical protein
MNDTCLELAVYWADVEAGDVSSKMSGGAECGVQNLGIHPTFVAGWLDIHFGLLRRGKF